MCTLHVVWAFNSIFTNQYILGTKELFNLPFLVLEARHLGGFTFCNFYRLSRHWVGFPRGFVVISYMNNLRSQLVLISDVLLYLHSQDYAHALSTSSTFSFTPAPSLQDIGLCFLQRQPRYTVYVLCTLYTLLPSQV